MSTIVSMPTLYQIPTGLSANESDWGDNPVILVTAEVLTSGTTIQPIESGLITCRVSDLEPFIDTPSLELS